jgi:heme exporter protein D
MYFDSWQQVLLMDGHGGFVWSAYAITVLVLAALVRGPLLRRRRALARVARRQLAEQANRETD